MKYEIGIMRYRSKRDYYEDNAVRYDELKREGNIGYVRGRICTEHKVCNTPYSVFCTVNEVMDEIVKVGCSDCAASAGKKTT